MSIADYNINNAPELEALPEGTEALVRISPNGVDLRTRDEDGTSYLLIRLSVFQHPNAKDPRPYFLGLPDDSLEEKENANRARRIRHFCESFNIDTGNGSVVAIVEGKDDWPGLEAWATVGMNDDPEYGEQNFVRRLRAK